MNRTIWWQGALGVAIALTGIVLTSLGSLLHLPRLNGPGAMVIVVGSAWLGIAVARARLAEGLRPGGQREGAGTLK